MSSSSLRLSLPPEFPDDQFEAIKDRVVAKVPNPSRELQEIAGGHNAVRFRLRACADYSDEFIESIHRAGVAPPLEDRYRQERQLFGFFVCGIATLDSFSYFLHFTVAQINPAAFRTQKRGHVKKIKLKNTQELFATHFSAEPISGALSAVVDDPKLEEWTEYRNILAHRTAPGRLVFMTVGDPQRTADWKIDPTRNIPFDANLTPPRLAWLVSTMAQLVEATAKFVDDHF